jgi:hypothetical protein
MTPILTGIVASGISGHLTPPWSPEGAYDSLANITLSTSVSTVTFSGIPSGYKHLQIRGMVLTSGATNPTWQANGEVPNSSHVGHHLWGNGSSAAANAQSGTVYWNYNPSSSYPSAFIMDWFDYSSNTKNKTMRTIAGSDTNGGTAEIALWSGLYTNTNPINSITLNGNGVSFTQYSNFALYGVK